MEDRYVGEILVRQGALTQERLEQALSVVDERGSKLKDVLSAAHILDDFAYVEALARDLGLPVITPTDRASQRSAIFSNPSQNFRGSPVGQCTR